MPESSAVAARSVWRFTIARDAPQAEGALAAWRLCEATGMVLADATLLGRNEGREVRALVDPRGARPTLYLKRFAPSRARQARREERALVELARRGLRVAPLLATARDEKGAILLVLGELSGRPLDEWLAGASLGERRRLSAALGEAIAAMHAAGVLHRQCFAWHVLVDRAGPLRWLDVAEASIGRSPAPLRERAKDLAALFATASRATWSLTHRARLLKACEPERARRRRLVAAIREERARLVRRARVPRDWRHREFRTSGQRLLVDESIAEAWATPELGEVANWLEPRGATTVRTRDGRSNLRWVGPPPAPGSTWFGKRFERAPWAGRSFAFRDFVLQRALDAIAIPTPPIVAVGRREGGRSVIWNAGVVPGTTLRELLPALASASERRALLAEAARLARRLHAAGFAHRDLYLDHFLVDESAGGRRLVLIDFTRAALFARLPERARTKDLAALEFSARGAGASRSERWRALLVYARGDRRLARRLARPALARADRTARHERRHGRAAPRA